MLYALQTGEKNNVSGLWQSRANGPEPATRFWMVFRMSRPFASECASKVLVDAITP
jgi:hypothetical protein